MPLVLLNAYYRGYSVEIYQSRLLKPQLESSGRASGCFSCLLLLVVVVVVVVVEE